MLENGFSVGDLTYQSFLYYNSECTEPEPWESHTSEYRDLISKGVDVSSFILSRINELGKVELMDVCGKDFNPIVSEIDGFHRDLLLLSGDIDRALELSRCERVMPLYTA